MTGKTYFEGSYDDPKWKLMEGQRKEHNELRKAEIELERDGRERALRRWCIEHVPATFVCADVRTEQAQAIYNWVCNLPKADGA